MTLANSAVVFSENDIEPPVQIVFDPPVGSCRVGPELGVGGDAADEVAHFLGDFVTDMPLAFHRADTAKSGPSALLVEPRDVRRAAVSSDFDPAVVVGSR